MQNKKESAKKGSSFEIIELNANVQRNGTLILYTINNRTQKEKKSVVHFFFCSFKSIGTFNYLLYNTNFCMIILCDLV